jgi:uncharacterized protein YaaN involved in tellurite resistance
MSITTTAEPVTSTIALDQSKEINANLPVLTNNSEYKERLRQLPEVQNMTSLISIEEPNSVLLFGQEPSKQISQMSDAMLSSIKSVKTEEVSEMLVELTGLMKKFDIQEIENPEKVKGILGKLKYRAKQEINKIFEKYEDMGKEVDRIYQLLKKYETDIYKANDILKKQFDCNVQYYQELEKYIVAGEIGLEEIDNYKNQIMSRTDISEDEKRMNCQKVDIVRELLEQRIQDLRIAENVAMQTCPMIQTNQVSNFNLLRKINSSFIITLPIFKQCLVSAVTLKRQQIQANAIKQLDDYTEELLIKNAQNTATQSVAIAKLAGGSSINVDTLEKTYDIIKKGIDETKQVNEEIARKRVEDAQKLENMKLEMKNNNIVR